jgi:hypothetical protein
MVGKRRKFDAEFREGAVRIVAEDRQADPTGREGPRDQRDDAGHLDVEGTGGRQGRSDG